MFNLADFRYCIGNPSAWDHYDDGMSERMRGAAAEIEQLHLDYQRICAGHDQLHDERDDARAEIERLRALVMLGDFSSLRPNSESFKLVQQIRREQSAGEQSPTSIDSRVEMQNAELAAKLRDKP